MALWLGWIDTFGSVISIARFLISFLFVLVLTILLASYLISHLVEIEREREVLRQ